MTTYATLAEAVEREILPALGDRSGEFDVAAIADKVVEYVTPTDPAGNLLVGRAGFVQVVDAPGFWEVAFRHER